MKTKFKCCKDKTKKGREIIVGFNKHYQHLLIRIPDKDKSEEQIMCLTRGTAIKVLRMLYQALQELDKK